MNSVISAEKSLVSIVGGYVAVAELCGDQRIASKIPLISSLFERFFPKPYRSYSIKEALVTGVCGYILFHVYKNIATEMLSYDQHVKNAYHYHQELYRVKCSFSGVVRELDLSDSSNDVSDVAIDNTRTVFSPDYGLC